MNVTTNILDRYHLTATEAYALLPLTTIPSSKWWWGDFAFIIEIEKLSKRVFLKDLTSIELEILPDTDAGRWVELYIIASRLRASP